MRGAFSSVEVLVQCDVEYTELTNDSDRLVDGVVATYSRCGHATESFGTSEASVRRCLAMMREECPEGEGNFYKDEDE